MAQNLFIEPSSAGAAPRRRRRFGCFVPLLVLVLLAALAGAACLAWRPARLAAAGLAVRVAERVDPSLRERKVVYEDRVVEKVVEKIVEKEVPVKEPPPSGFVPYKSVDVAELYNGFHIRTELEALEGGLASVERALEESAAIEFKLRIKVPKPNRTLADLSKLNERLPAQLPGLPAMLETAAVSDFYHGLYDIKTKRMQRSLTRLNSLLSRHNYYDCDTVLELTHPESGRKALLMQGDMDVVSDGSDGDRSPEYDEYIAKSQYYQPFTSYGWKKRTAQPNPLLERWEKRLREREEELAKPGLTAARKTELREAAATLKKEIADLKARSFLIARKDPFVVVPLSFLGYQSRDPFGPAIGDYVAVLHGGKVYPAILGDAGPTFKVGEASLRIAQEIDPNSSPYRRPVSDLTVTYLIFPGTADQPFAPPDLEQWRSRCAALLGEIGGLGEGVELHVWKDLFAQPAAGEPAAEGGEGTPPEEPPQPGAEDGGPDSE